MNTKFWLCSGTLIALAAAAFVAVPLLTAPSGISESEVSQELQASQPAVPTAEELAKLSTILVHAPAIDTCHNCFTEIRMRLEETPGVVNIRGDMVTNRFQFHAPLDREAVDKLMSSISQSMIAAGEKDYLAGHEIIEFKPPEEK